MDLGDNNLSGTIPLCFQNLSGMTGMTEGYIKTDFIGRFEQSLNQVMKGVALEYTTMIRYLVNMDISSNKLVGEIPKELVLLAGLLGLNLSNNHLTGPIPDQIGGMKSLMSLDLSVNDLLGMIPQSMSDLTFLVKCKHDKVLEIGKKADEDEEDDDGFEKMWIYGVTRGFTTGFMGILRILVVKKRWRLAFFSFVGGYIGKKL
ncbi:hypothetical protein LXL04_011894 [Taraxacum kok-saghyz]